MIKDITLKILNKYAFLELLLAMVILCFFVYKTTHLKLYDDPNYWVPKYSPQFQINEFIQEKFGGANVVTIEVSVKNGDIFNYETLSKIRRITHAVLLMEGVVPAYITSLAASKVKYLKGEKDFLDCTRLMLTIPETSEEWKRLRYGVYHNPTIYGSLVSFDAKSTIIIADFRTGEKVSLTRTNPSLIYQQIIQIINKEKDDNNIIRCAGTPIIIGWLNSDTFPLMFLSFIAFFIVIGLVLFIAFRNLIGLILPLFLGMVSTVWAFGLYPFFFGETLRSGSAFIVPFIIMAAAACHSVQFLKRFYDEEYSEKLTINSAIANTYAVLFRPMFLAVITDFTGFLVLAFVPFENVCVLGRIALLGLIAVFINIYVVLLPSLSLFAGKPKKSTLKEESPDTSKIEQFITKPVELLVYPTRARWAIIGTLSGIFVISLFCLPFLNPSQDNTFAIHNLLTRSYKNNNIYKMEQGIKETFEGIYPFNILIESKQVEGLKDPKVLKKIDTYAEFLQKNLPDEVFGTTHLATFMKLMHRFMHEENPEYYKVPDTRKAISDYLFLYTLNEPGSFDMVVDYQYQKCVLVAYVKDTKRETVEKVFKTASKFAQEHFNDDNVVAKVGGGAIGITKAFNDNIGRWLINASLFSALASFILACTFLRSFVGGFFLLTPLFVGTVIWLGIMCISGIEINSNITSGMAIAMGMGIDAEIYFLYRFREEFGEANDFKASLVLAFKKIRKALIFSHLSLIIGCWFLIPIPLYVGYLGFSMGMIILVCFLTSFIISPFLWSITQPKFLIGK